MMMQSRELEILQAKIREADNRLKSQDSTPAEGGSSRNDGGKREGQGSTGEDAFMIISFGLSNSDVAH